MTNLITTSSLLSVTDAQQLLINSLDKEMPGETIPVEKAINRVLFQKIISPMNVPPFTNSSMDGFAVIASDLEKASLDNPVQLEIIEQLPAGIASNSQIKTKQSIQIMTGAVLPTGADAVIPIEFTNIQTDEENPKNVQIYTSVKKGDYIRYTGSDFHQGETLLKKGVILQPRHIGLLASLGINQVKVYKKPKIALFSNGDELLPPQASLSPGKIRDANTSVLSMLINKSGGKVLNYGIAPDNYTAIKKVVDKAIEEEADMILSSAGVSMGKYDYVRSVIQNNGNLSFWKVNMRPGKPLAFGHYQSTPFIGLPGNPVSAYIGFLVFVAPAINKITGKQNPLQRNQITVITTEPIQSDGRESYLRAYTTIDNGKYKAKLSGHQGSGNLLGLAQANTLLIVPSGVKSLPAGTKLNAWLLSNDV